MKIRSRFAVSHLIAVTVTLLSAFLFVHGNDTGSGNDLSLTERAFHAEPGRYRSLYRTVSLRRMCMISGPNYASPQK